MDSLKENHFETEIGPGVYDIHSPRVSSVEEIVKMLKIMLKKVDREKLWINPDCGLKTRGVTETDASLRNMVEAAKQISMLSGAKQIVEKADHFTIGFFRFPVVLKLRKTIYQIAVIPCLFLLWRIETLPERFS